MIIELIARTENTNVYGVYDQDRSPAGEVEEVLTGPNRGCYAYTLNYRHSREQIMRAFQNRRNTK